MFKEEKYPMKWTMDGHALKMDELGHTQDALVKADEENGSYPTR